jgi:predicted glutamine amidotransferase
MFFQCANEPFYINYEVLKKFLKSCHWTYLQKYNLIGHHGLGYGFAYIPENTNYIVIKRDLTPIYYTDWKNLTKIKTRFFLIHARKAYPWKKTAENIHPINIGQKYMITHNGTIKNSSIPKLTNPTLEKIKRETSLDTRKYLCYIMDELYKNSNLKTALESVFENLKLGIGANAFLFNSRECNIIKRQNEKFTGRHRTLFISKKDNYIFAGTTPLKPKMKEIPNNTLIYVNLLNLKTKIYPLELN